MLGGKYIKDICLICGTQSRDKTEKKKVKEAFLGFTKYLHLVK